MLNRWNFLKTGFYEGIKVSPDNWIFEAPLKAQQVWFIQRFGPDVNLGNIATNDVLPLETLRLGLRADTFDDPNSSSDAASDH